MRAKNWPLILKVRDHIMCHPEEHNQDDWIQRSKWHCGTIACVAGWATIFSGADVPKSLRSQEWWLGRDTGKLIDITEYGMRGPKWGEQFPDGTMHVSEYAQHVLGLDWVEADRLFGGSLTREGIFEIIDGWYAEDHPGEVIL